MDNEGLVGGGLVDNEVLVGGGLVDDESFDYGVLVEVWWKMEAWLILMEEQGDLLHQ